MTASNSTSVDTMDLIAGYATYVEAQDLQDAPGIVLPPSITPTTTTVPPSILTTTLPITLSAAG